jgi:putative transposase
LIAVDKFGDTIDFTLSEHRAEAADTAFFKQAIETLTSSLKKSSWIKAVPTIPGWGILISYLMLAGLISFVEIFQVKYLNNLIEQDHLHQENHESHDGI